MAIPTAGGLEGHVDIAGPADGEEYGVDIEWMGRRATWTPLTALIAGAWPIGLLAALLSVQRGFDTHVFDRAAEGRKPDMVSRLGVTYHHGDVPVRRSRLSVSWPHQMQHAHAHAPVSCMSG